MAEKLKKIALYFQKPDAYWKVSDERPAFVVDPGPLGRYPLDLLPRLTGHFTTFDESHLPIRRSADGTGFWHNYATICAFGLAHWDAYLLSGKAEHRAHLLNAAGYLMRTADRRDDILRLRTEIPGLGHVGKLCGMFQGEAMSVLCRAWHATGDEAFLQAAVACLGPFDLPVAEDGVLGFFGTSGIPWYEEDPDQPLKHILNGMIYALFGIWEVGVVAGHTRARELFEKGVNSVAAALPSYDNGFWSWYWLAESDPPYIASMLYHNLHVCQLTILAKLTGKDVFDTFAGRFQRYAKSPSSRMRAAMAMSLAKLRRVS